MNGPAPSNSRAPPVGRPKKGMTWDVKTGLWVAPASANNMNGSARNNIYSPPVGRPKKDMTWDVKNGQWVAPASANNMNGSARNNSYSPPVGRPKKGMTWDVKNGQWVVPASANNTNESARNNMYSPPVGRSRKGMTWDVKTGQWNLNVGTVHDEKSMKSPQNVKVASSNSQKGNLHLSLNSSPKKNDVQMDSDIRPSLSPNSHRYMKEETCQQEEKQRKSNPNLGPRRIINLPRDDESLGIAIFPHLELGGILVHSVSPRSSMLGKLQPGDLIIRVNQVPLNGRNIFEFMAILKNNKKRMRKMEVQRVRTWGQEKRAFLKRNVIKRECKQLPPAKSQFAEPEEIFLKPGFVEFEIKAVPSVGMIVSCIDPVIELNTGIQKGDLILEFDGHKLACADITHLKEMLLSTLQRSRWVKIQKSILNVRKNQACENRHSTSHLAANHNDSTSSGTSQNRACVPRRVTARLLRDCPVPREECDVMPVFFGYIAGDRESEGRADMRTKLC